MEVNQVEGGWVLLIEMNEDQPSAINRQKYCTLPTE